MQNIYLYTTEWIVQIEQMYRTTYYLAFNIYLKRCSLDTLYVPIFLHPLGQLLHQDKFNSLLLQ